MEKDSDGRWHSRKFSFADDFIEGSLADLFFDNFIEKLYDDKTFQDADRQCKFLGRLASSYSIGKSGQIRLVEQCVELYSKVQVPIYQFKGTLLDKNCNVATKEVPASSICGSLSVDFMVSPISLDWLGTEAARGASSSVVQFKLNPKSPADTVLWRASETFPLLAIDINGDGIINDGSELFGEWTFGGKRTGSSDPASTKETSSVPWRDGFEALASLDRDGDQQLTGDELAKVLLFFDRDRNGRSEEQELISAHAAGLRKLKTTSDFKDSASRDVVALQGFERSEGSQVIVGRSVDWYANTYSSHAEALDRLAVQLANPPKVGESPQEHQQIQHDGRGDVPISARKPTDEDLSRFDGELSGLWKWHIQGKPSTGGAFLFASDRGVVLGASIVEIPVTQAASGSSEASQALIMNTFMGFMTADADSEGLQFETKNGSVTAASKASLLADGSLRGETTQRASDGSTIRYTWIATKSS
jgi:hypothetical protein